LDLGLIVTNVYWALQYVPTKPFEPFVKDLVEVRIRSVNSNTSVGDRAKFTLNSCVGRFGLNLSKHRVTKFVRKENLSRHVRTPLLEKERSLVSEYETNLHEVVKKKRTDVDKIPGSSLSCSSDIFQYLKTNMLETYELILVHVSLFVYQMSKLWFFKFIKILHEFMIPDSFTLGYLGKSNQKVKSKN